MENNYYGIPVTLPNSTAILVLGIVSIVTCCCYGIPGLICGIIALVLANNASKLYQVELGNYTESSYKNVNAGKICAIIGIVLSILYLVSIVWSIFYFGWESLTDPELLQERMQELMNQ
jgi:hypothetical protein